MRLAKHTKESRACELRDLDPDWEPTPGKISYGVCQVCGRRWRFDERPQSKSNSEAVRQIIILDKLSSAITSGTMDEIQAAMSEWRSRDAPVNKKR